MTTITRRQLSASLAALACAARVASVSSAAAAIRQSGIQEVVVSVFDIDLMARAFVEAGDFLKVALPDAAPEQFGAWHVPEGCTRIEQAHLVHRHSAEARGSMRLVRFHGVEQRVMRSSQRSWDTGGIFDVDVYSRDVSKAYRKLQTLGWTALGEPVDYSESILHVRQVVASGPNGFMLAMIQRYSPPVDDVPPFEGMSAIFNSTQMVADLDRALDFYTRALGWSIGMRFDITDQAEPGADVLGLPLPQAEKAVRRLAMLRGPGENPAAVELIENRSMHGRDFSKDCVAPNVGILCLRIPVADARAYAQQVRARGVRLYAEPQRVPVAPYGTLDMFSVRSPEGAILEFYDQA
jgi:catechol 2,3-dioxygenase-like lactoylglutathione lyase family enzyme